MDLRIVNTCNNDCLYCLEQSYRNREKFIYKDLIFSEIEKNTGKKIISFYGGNPLLHPDILEIIKFCKESGYKSIGILSNTSRLNSELINKLTDSGLNSFGFYFNSFNSFNHSLISGNGITLKELKKNIELIRNSGLIYKVIIHINFLNIKDLYKYILILNLKYGVKDIEFINYFPFDRSYENKKYLEYSYEENRKYIDKLFNLIIKLKIYTKFFKFNRTFFGKYESFYDYKNGILKQIGEEDYNRLKSGKVKAFCYDNRCKNCFIKDYCNLNEL